MAVKLPEASRNPRVVYDEVLRDLIRVFRNNNVPPKMIEGAEIAMTLAYRLGEQAGRNKGWAE